MVCWTVLAAMASAPAELRGLEGVYGASLIEILCAAPVGGAGYAPTLGMWALMSAGMMAPTALPAFATYDDLRHTADVGPSGFAKLLGGYLSVWLGFSALAAAAHMALYQLGLINVFGESLSTGLSAALLIAAGLYQLSALKAACLSRCRAPLSFFMQHWAEGPFRNGLRLGVDCVGCCWALMLLGFVGGVMNLAFMGLAMALMMLEKLPDLGARVTRPLGWILIASGAAISPPLT